MTILLFLNQTKSNFNNKYQVIYSISDWRQKDKVKNLLNTIKINQHIICKNNLKREELLLTI